MQAKHGAAAPSYPLFSSFFVASTSSCFPPHPLAPTHTDQPSPTPFFVLRYHVPPSFFLLSRQATAFPSLLRRFLLPSASRCSNARCYNTSRTRCCRYTFFLPFSFPPRSSSAPSTRVHGRLLPVLSPHRYRFLFVYVAAILRVVAPSRVVFAARSSLHRGRHGNARSTATGKFLRLSIFGKLPLSPRAPF